MSLPVTYYGGVEWGRFIEPAKRLKLRWLRYNAFWQDGWGRDNLAAAIEHAASVDANLIAVLMTRDDMSDPEKRTEFMHWCLAAMRAFPQVRNWQIGNEVDVQRSPTPGEPYGFQGSAEDYAVLLSGVYNRARAMDGRRIWMSGLYFEGNIDEWLDKFEHTADGAPFHVGAVHAYIFGDQSWEKPWTYLRKLESRWARHKRPVVITETNYLCHSTGNPNCPQKRPPEKGHGFYQRQREYVQYTLSRAHHERRSVLFYTDSLNQWHDCGAWFSDGTPKPWRKYLEAL